MTTALRAGSGGGLAYLPLVALAAAAGFLLMEMVARITVVSGQSLGTAVGRYGRALPLLCFGAVAFGCCAYQAGNLLGAFAGLELLTGFADRPVALLFFGLLITLLMWSGNTGRVGRLLALVVTAIALVFVAAAVGLLGGGGAGGGRSGPLSPALVVSLVGTTIVPYNFFLAAGLGSGSRVGDMRRGLLLSFLVGGFITGAIVVVGGAIGAFDGFASAAAVLDTELAGYGRPVLGLGLLAAGLSSATTAPLAAALAGRELLGQQAAPWATDGARFRLVWLLVLALGLAVALLDLDLVYVILAAQLLNGILVPLVGSLVLVIANDRYLLGGRTNRGWQNGLGLVLLALLAYRNVEVILGVFGVSDHGPALPGAVTLLVTGAVARLIYRRRV